MSTPVSPEASLPSPFWGTDLLAILRNRPQPLQEVLDLLRSSLDARVAALVGPGEGRIRRSPRDGSGIGVPGAGDQILLELAARAMREGRGLLVGVDGSLGPLWAAAWPVPCRGGLAALVTAGSAPLEPGVRSSPAEVLERLAPWVALARETEDGPAPQIALHRDRSSAEHPVAGGGEEGAGDGAEIMAESPAMRAVLRTVDLVATSDAAVLIEGESGTGKELVARAVHARSRRVHGPFVPENCAACPEGLLESEFFGVERGAFTGAHRTKPGLLERAHGGTLFLDEIGEMDLPLQRKLLRALQEREVRRVGGAEAIPVDFRLVSATNRDLAEDAGAGRFRSDLLYRIDVVTIRLPPLRERREEIPLLARRFLERQAKAAGLPLPDLDPRALSALLEYPWPGNVRELENEMSRAVALRLRAVTPDSLSPKVIRPRREAPSVGLEELRMGRSLAEVEKDILGGIIREALRQTRGNKFRAAQLLRITKSSLYRRLRRYSIGSAGDGRAPVPGATAEESIERA